MSELTRCNRCVFNDMRARAAGRGATVILSQQDGWVAARYSDRDEPSSWFLELSDGCVC